MESVDLTKESNIKKVAILGAGASAEAGAPTIKKFWDKVDELMAQGKFNADEANRIKSIKQKREEMLPDSDIEEFFSYVDFQINFDVLIPTPKSSREIINRIINKKDKEWIPIPEVNNIGKEKSNFVELKKEVSWLITKTLEESLKSTNNEIEQCYKKLIQNFDVTLSFNWDILFERAYRSLNGNSIPTKNLGFGKGICKPALLKLHGSIDWGECQQCGGLHMSDTTEHIVYENKICPNCNKSNLIETSILPALTKFEKISKTEKPPYRNIWSCATHAISEAKEIYFFGYSLSDNDAHTKIFLKSGILNNINSNLKIYVVDKCCCEDLINRYTRAFEHKVKPEFIKKSFKEFLDKVV